MMFLWLTHEGRDEVWEIFLDLIQQYNDIIQEMEHEEE